MTVWWNRRDRGPRVLQRNKSVPQQLAHRSRETESDGSDHYPCIGLNSQPWNRPDARVARYSRLSPMLWFVPKILTPNRWILRRLFHKRRQKRNLEGRTHGKGARNIISRFRRIAVRTHRSARSCARHVPMT